MGFYCIIYEMEKHLHLTIIYSFKNATSTGQKRANPLLSMRSSSASRPHFCIADTRHLTLSYVLFHLVRLGVTSILWIVMRMESAIMVLLCLFHKAWHHAKVDLAIFLNIGSSSAFWLSYKNKYATCNETVGKK